MIAGHQKNKLLDSLSRYCAQGDFEKALNAFWDDNIFNKYDFLIELKNNHRENILDPLLQYEKKCIEESIVPILREYDFRKAEILLQKRPQFISRETEKWCAVIQQEIREKYSEGILSNLLDKCWFDEARKAMNDDPYILEDVYQRLLIKYGKLHIEETIVPLLKDYDFQQADIILQHNIQNLHPIGKDAGSYVQGDAATGRGIAGKGV
jgi:hypothetical protein